MLRLRQVRKILPRRCAPAGRSARRPDPRGHHPVEMQRVRRLRGVLLQPWHRRDEAAPADQPRPGKRLQVYQDRLLLLRQAHCTRQCGRHLFGLPDQGPHQKTAGGSSGPRQGAAGRTRGQARRRKSRTGRCGADGSGNGASCLLHHTGRACTRGGTRRFACTRCGGRGSRSSGIHGIVNVSLLLSASFTCCSLTFSRLSTTITDVPCNYFHKEPDVRVFSCSFKQRKNVHDNEIKCSLCIRGTPLAEGL